MDLDSRYPALPDLRRRARRRIPHFVWEFLDSGTGTEAALHRNRAALDAVIMRPAVLTGEATPELETAFLGEHWAAPFGIAPVGMSGLVWPDAERRLARLAARENLPYCLSTVASQPPEAVGPLTGGRGWFQLYPPRDARILTDMLTRIHDSGFSTLVLTVDVPVASRRERQRRGGLTQPPRLTPRLLAHVLQRPAWALGMARHGMPRMRFIESYSTHKGPLPSTAHAGYLLRTSPDWEYLRALRREWPGRLVVKGVLEAEDAVRLATEGVDAVWVSNHAGRQFDAAPAALDALPAIRAALGPDFPLIFDSGVQSGLDILRALALGADFVMLGRAWHFGLAAFGDRGAAHVAHILRDDLTACMGQMGLSRPDQARTRLMPAGNEPRAPVQP